MQHFFVGNKNATYVVLVDTVLEALRTLSQTGVVEGTPPLLVIKGPWYVIHPQTLGFRDASPRQVGVPVRKKLKNQSC